MYEHVPRWSNHILKPRLRVMVPSQRSPMVMDFGIGWRMVSFLLSIPTWMEPS